MHLRNINICIKILSLLLFNIDEVKYQRRNWISLHRTKVRSWLFINSFKHNLIDSFKHDLIENSKWLTFFERQEWQKEHKAQKYKTNHCNYY